MQLQGKTQFQKRGEKDRQTDTQTTREKEGGELMETKSRESARERQTDRPTDREADMQTEKQRERGEKDLRGEGGEEEREMREEK